MRRRRYTVTLEVETYDTKTAMALRALLKRTAATIEPPTAVTVTYEETDGILKKGPIVLAERVME